MLDISVATDIQRLRVKSFELRKNVINKATASALNKTSASARTEVTRAIRQKIKNMKIARIKKRISIIRATPSNQVAIIRVRQGAIPPGAFKLPGHGDALYVHVGNKHRMIVSKSGKSAGKKISSGYQLAPVQSVQVTREFAKSYARQTMERVVRARFPVMFERELKYYGNR